jgi:hypothetical protein
MRSFTLLFVALLAGGTARAQTQCLDDAECAPGVRCSNGYCGTPPAPAPAPFSYRPVYAPPPSGGTGWAGGAYTGR